jgi:hypothetical protein
VLLLWTVTPCVLVGRYQHFEEMYYHHTKQQFIMVLDEIYLKCSTHKGNKTGQYGTWTWNYWCRHLVLSVSDFVSQSKEMDDIYTNTSKVDQANIYIQKKHKQSINRNTKQIKKMWTCKMEHHKQLRFKKFWTASSVCEIMSTCL